MNKTPCILGLLLIAASTALAQLAVAGDPSAAGFVAERLDRIDVAINAEIAAATGLSASAVGTTLARARRRLVEAYDALEKHHVAR